MSIAPDAPIPSLSFASVNEQDLVEQNEGLVEQFRTHQKSSPKPLSRDFQFLKIPEDLYNPDKLVERVKKKTIQRIDFATPNDGKLDYEVSNLRIAKTLFDRDQDLIGYFVEDGIQVGDFELRIDNEQKCVTGWFKIENTLYAIHPAFAGVKLAETEKRVHVIYHSPPIAVHDDVSDDKLVGIEADEVCATRPATKRKNNTSTTQSDFIKISVMILYSKRCHHGKTDIDLLKASKRLVDEINQALKNSNIDDFEIVLFDTPIRTDYLEAACTKLDYENLKDGHDELNEFRTLRDTEKVHLLALITDNTAVGRAKPRPSKPQEAVCAVDVQTYSVSKFGFAHELGHLLGADHDSQFSLQQHGVGSYQHSLLCSIGGRYEKCWQSLMGIKDFGDEFQTNSCYGGTIGARALRDRKLVLTGIGSGTVDDVVVQTNIEYQNRDKVIDHVNLCISKFYEQP